MARRPTVASASARTAAVSSPCDTDRREPVSTDHREFQRSFYDEHYVQQANAARDQLAHPMFRAFWDRLGGRLLELCLADGPAVDAGPLRVVEPACGEGFLGAAVERMAAGRGIDVAYTGSDLSEAAVELARSAVAGTVMVGDATEVLDGMAAGSQHVVVAKNLLHHIEDPERFVAAAARVVGPRGTVLIVEARLGCPQCFAISLLDVRRERYFFRGRQRSLRALREGGVHLVGEECFNVLPFEIAFHIRPAVFRRLLGTSNPQTLGRISRADGRLEQAVPWLAHYFIWKTVPAVAGT